MSKSYIEMRLLRGKITRASRGFKSHLVKFASKILLKILSISNWGVRYILRDAFSQIEKMKNLVTPSFNVSYLYVRRAKVAWNATLWEQKSYKSTQLEKM
jgi:hypothetical protein